MPDPASEQGEHIFTLWRWAWVAALITGGITWAPDVLGDVALPPQGRRPRGPGADALQPAARDLLHDRPGRHGDRLLRAHRRHAERRARRRGRARPHHLRRGPAVAVDLQLRRRARGRLAQPLGGRHRVLHPDARAAGRGDHRVPAPLTRRDPRLRRARLPDEDGRHPRPRQPLPHHAHRDRRLPRQLLRALRGLPLADALQRQGRQPRGLRHLPPGPRRLRPHLGRAAHRRHRTPARNRACRRARRSRNDHHRSPVDDRNHRRTPPARPADRASDHLDRPQGDRQPLPRHVVRLVPHRRA